MKRLMDLRIPLLVPLLAGLAVGSGQGRGQGLPGPSTGMDSRAGYPLALVPSPVERAPYRSRWSPAKEECLPPPRYAFPHQRQWRIDFGAFYPSAPRQRRPLAILSPEGSRIKRATVFVVTPSGATFHTTTKVSANKLHFLYWPTDFPGAPKVQPAGTYTVFWRAKPHALLGCAGWTVHRGAHA